ncbi:PQ-loop domain-containing transporter [Legionella brunensis]|uniref:PQ loop repeat protein n=1 Tax=Legionella brunensis TaxID=29422 RepID=A0A0W0SK71_9GAMM|nr:PQ-loop domain-containing transporter [Legionella brunensis]KTC83724.1 hypothetical protein Lbru_1693 [Legionella brunensis]
MDVSHQVIEFGFSVSLLVNALLFIPQIVSLLKCKSAQGVSLITFAGFNIIQLFTVLHGVFAKDYILTAGFFLSFLTCGMVTWLVIYYRYIKKQIPL